MMKYIYLSLILFSVVSAYDVKCTVNKVSQPPYNVTCLADKQCHLVVPVFFSFKLPTDYHECNNSVFYFECGDAASDRECYDWYKTDKSKEFICVTKGNSCNISHIMYYNSEKDYVAVMVVLSAIGIVVLVCIIYAFFYVLRKRCEYQSDYPPFYGYHI